MRLPVKDTLKGGYQGQETVKVKALGHDRARYGWKTASLVLLEEIRYETKDETGESTKAT